MDDTFLLDDTTVTIPYLDHTIFPDLPNPRPENPSAFVFNSLPFQEERDQVVAAATAAVNKKLKKPRKSSKIEQTPNDENLVDERQKRVIRRDTERHRRQEMANLYASLREVLPVECIKGKSRKMDQLHQAADYIKQKEEEIKELRKKNDDLNDLFGENSARTFSSNVEFIVQPCRTSDGGIEILISSDLSAEDDWFPLSRVMRLLRNEGLHVVNSVHTKVNRIFHCVIRTNEVASQTNYRDLSSLRQKLAAEAVAWKR